MFYGSDHIPGTLRPQMTDAPPDGVKPYESYNDGCIGTYFSHLTPQKNAM